MPDFTVFAGPNGSGKSSLTRLLQFEGRKNLLDPDAIARRINPEDVRRAAITAAREVIHRTKEYLETGLSFGLETTLSGATAIRAMREARLNGFRVRLIYLCLDTPERHIERVRQRVLTGGHAVQDEDVRRRYRHSLANLPVAPGLAHQAEVYDNSGKQARLIFQTRRGEVAWVAASEPEWARSARLALTDLAAQTQTSPRPPESPPVPPR